MPLYEYQCQQCGRRSETLQNMGAAPLTTCEVCGGPLKRLVSSPSVQFKGSGWYVTDYGRKGGGGAAKESGRESGGAKEGGDKPTGDAVKSEAKVGGESKPAASSTTTSTPSSSSSSGGAE